MSRINDLIKELCPNGMNFKSIDSVADLYYGKGNNIPKDGGDYPVYGCYGIVSSTSTFNNEDTPIVGHIGSAGKVSWGDGKHYVTYNGTICMPKNKNELNSRYLYHVLLDLHLENYVKGSQPFLSSSDFGPIKIAIPPLEVQEEIVKILDKFGKLEAELEAELEARKSQYEFWRGKLFEKESVKYMKISEFAKCCAGATPSTSHSEYWENGTIPWMSSGEVNNIEIYDTEKKITELGYNSSSTKMLPINTVVVALAGQGKTRGLVAITRKEVCTNQSLCGIVPDERVDNEYLFHYLQSRYKDLRRISSGDGTRGGLNLKMINDYEVPVPSIDEQKKIINVLNRFSRLVNSYTDGIPAEIELRRQQYEYYRNKLLSFEELVNE